MNCKNKIRAAIACVMLGLFGIVTLTIGASPVDAGGGGGYMIDVAVVQGNTIAQESTTCPSGGGACWREFVMDSDTIVVCQYPMLDYNECEDFHVNDCIEIDGYVDKFEDGRVVMFANGVKSCDCEVQHTFDLRYSLTQSDIHVPSTSTTNLGKYGPVGKSIRLGGDASQPGTYLITGVDPSGKRLNVSPTPQTATDQALDVTIVRGQCPEN